MRNTSLKGFTLVELIVVITILAILGTISFLSLQGYSESARNAKRVDGLGKINTVIENQKIGGKSLLGFVFTGQEVINAKIAGAIPTVGGNYKAGLLNSQALNVKQEDFTDPLYTEVYRVGVTTTSRGQFEASATLEEGNNKIAKIIGTWAPRLGVPLTGGGGSGEDKFVLNNPQHINALEIGDQISGIGVSTGTTIENISNDGLNVFLSEPLIAPATSITLADDEVLSLIASSGDPNIAVTDNTQNVPYASDTSILLDAIPFLQGIGSVSEDVGNSASVDTAGNSYIAGYYDNGGNDDINISKLNGSGATIWTKNIGSTGTDTAEDIIVDSVGSVYVAGYFNGTVDFGGTTLTSSGSSDIYVMKLDNSGVTQWVTQMGGTSADRGRGISLDVNGNVLVTGYFLGTASFGSTTHTSGSSSAAFAAKLDSSGAVLWATMLDGTSNDEGAHIAGDSLGNVLVTGFYTSNSTHGSTVHTSAGSADAYLTKIDTDGLVLWSVTMGGVGNDRATGIVTDSNNDAYIVGYFADDSTHGVTTLTHLGSNDIFVTKVSNSGSISWARSLSGGSNDTGNGIGIDQDDNIYIAGYFGGTSTHGGETITSAGSIDIFVTKLNNSGTVLWANAIGGAGDDRGWGITVDLIGNSYTTGYFNGSFTYGSTTITSSGDKDIFVIKLDTAGDTL